jgi:hypothetical protein
MLCEAMSWRRTHCFQVRNLGKCLHISAQKSHAFRGRSPAGVSLSQRDIAYQPRATLWDTCPAPGRVLKERRPVPAWRAYPRSPQMRRSFRTHEWIHIETQGVALGWYASPLQGESKCPNSRSPPQGDSKCLNSGSPLQEETGADRGVHSHHPFDGCRASRKAGRKGDRHKTPHGEQT